MCCFSMPVDHVSATKIFVRKSGLGRQILVYEMRLVAAAASDVAMILPLPVPPGPREEAVRFINLEGCAGFFDSLDAGFSPRHELTALAASAADRGTMERRPPLIVYRVGEFDATFIPTLHDFDRVDARFQLPVDVWNQLPQYADYGFAVFKLRSDGGRVKFHPMAFEFPSRNPQTLFVPTVHIHDRSYHPIADFDHDIYCQPDGDERFNAGFEESRGSASSFMDVGMSAGIVKADAPCFRQSLNRRYRNADVLIARGHDDLTALRLEGNVDQSRYSGGVTEFVDVVVSEIVLHHRQQIEDFRKSHPLPPEGDRGWAASREHDRLLQVAIDELKRVLGDDVQLAREVYARQAPKGLVNSASHFENGLDSTLSRAYRGAWW